MNFFRKLAFEKKEPETQTKHNLTPPPQKNKNTLKINEVGSVFSIRSTSGVLTFPLTKQKGQIANPWKGIDLHIKKQNLIASQK